ncbi:MAG: hypothetical protein JWN67_2027 [Actinomycetia bacterium]|nr:hypothetical protein [Actinomycetes bacterium]
MQVAFRRHTEKGRVACSWDAVRGARTRIPGSYMPAGVDVPHDVLQYVVEAATGFRHGFWGLLSDGATFKSTGRRRTKPGRQLIAEHRAELQTAEHLPHEHVTAWRAGERTPVTALIDVAFEQWRSLDAGEVLVFEWPSPEGRVNRS